MGWQDFCLTVTIVVGIFLIFDIRRTWRKQGILTQHDVIFYAVLLVCCFGIIVVCSFF